MRGGLVVDSSALLAIIYQAPDKRFYIEQIANSSSVYLSTANWVESSICCHTAGSAGLLYQFDDLIRRAAIKRVPVSEEQARLAREAHQIFGKGNGHPAQLNFGDCFSYALSKNRNDPLLFKRQDFAHTDLSVVRAT